MPPCSHYRSKSSNFAPRPLRWSFYPPECLSVFSPRHYSSGSYRLDLGVGIRFAGGYLVGPDNGLFSGILSQSPAISAVNLNNASYWRTPNPSTTFHGRDLFATISLNNQP